MKKQKTEVEELRALIVETVENHLDKSIIKRQLSEVGELRALIKEGLQMFLEKEKSINLSLTEMRGEIGGIGESNGKFSESYFFDYLSDTSQFGGKVYDEVEKGVRRTQKMPDGKKLKTEFDVVMYNKDSIALVEVKYRVRKDDIKYLIEKQVDNFKRIYPFYANYVFYLGIAGMSFEEDVERDALINGVGILRPKGENVEVIDGHLRAY